MIYLKLYWEFFKIGLFAVGGGMATLPFLQDLGERSGWYSPALLSDMVAISESTPGPIGINMATYVGCTVGGFFGGIVATLGEITPSLIIVIFLSRSLEQFSKSPLVAGAFYGLRPGVTGLIAAAGLGVMELSLLRLDQYQATGALLDLFAWEKCGLYALLLFAILRWKNHPVCYIALSAGLGILLGL